MDIDHLTDSVISSAIEVRRALGPRLLESAYEMCLCRELDLRQISFERQKPIPNAYKWIKLDCGYREYLVADQSVLIEIKSLDASAAIHEAQLPGYLRLVRCQ